jgi:hypothetical protein
MQVRVGHSLQMYQTAGLTWTRGFTTLRMRVGKWIFHPRTSTYQHQHTMGDKSPKANQKKSAQKQAKANHNSQTKQQAAPKK